MTEKNYSYHSHLGESSPEQYTRLKAEAARPYKLLRRFFYLSFAASGSIGAFIFALRTLARKDADNALPNLALQVRLVVLMVFLWYLDRDGKNSV